MDTNRIHELFKFIADSPSCYHVIDNMKQQLTTHGYKELLEIEPWEIRTGGKYFVTRNLSSIIAFCIPTEIKGGFHITASHSDSPSFKIKEHAEVDSEHNYLKLNTEKYGGMIMSSWFDRPLSVAGRLLVNKGQQIDTTLVHVHRDMVLIPNLAVHMNREINDGYKYNPQVDLLPLYGNGEAKGTFMTHIARAAHVREEDILGSDLFLYNRMPGTIWGAADEFISCPKLDDLQCAFSSLKGLLEARGGNSIAVHCVLDNEEVGSTSKQGAASTFLKDTLQRICLGLDTSQELYYQMLSKSFMISADNAHAMHPNHPQKSDLTNQPYMNKGIVIKHSSNQHYTTDGVSAAIFGELCTRAAVPYQTFVNRSDIAGGSTLGNLSSTQVPINSVDIGLAQLAMHSSYETAGAMDTDHLIQALKTFNESTLSCLGDGHYVLHCVNSNL